MQRNNGRDVLCANLGSAMVPIIIVEGIAQKVSTEGVDMGEYKCTRPQEVDCPTPNKECGTDCPWWKLEKKTREK